MGLTQEIVEEILSGVVGNLRESYWLRVKPDKKFSEDFKKGFYSAVETLKLIKNDIVGRAEKVDEEEES